MVGHPGELESRFPFIDQQKERSIYWQVGQEGFTDWDFTGTSGTHCLPAGLKRQRNCFSDN